MSKQKTFGIKIRTDYFIECPNCGGKMKLLNVTEALVFNPQVGQLWQCEKCAEEFHLVMKKHKPNQTKGADDV